ncbi:MAG: hypothetical protein SNH55_00580 [Rikenellaceae bacterium]
MRKILFLVASMLCFVSVASAQNFKKGSKVLSVSAGYSNIYDCPLSLSYEVGVYNINEKSSIGLNGYLGYAWSKDDIQYGADKDDTYGTFDYDDIFVAVGANYHRKTNVKRLDLYGGFRIGYDFRLTYVNWDDDDVELIIGDKVSGADKGIVYNVHVGARYYIFRNFAINSEIGYGISIVNMGFSYKF